MVPRQHPEVMRSSMAEVIETAIEARDETRKGQPKLLGFRL
jgi:hypothetical protein